MGERGPAPGEGGRPRLKRGEGAVDDRGYKRTSVGPAGAGRQDRLHRAVAGSSPGDGPVHHKDGNKGNYSRDNLQQLASVAAHNRKRKHAR